MKKSIVLVIIALISFCSFGFASDAPTVDRLAQNSFNRQFSSAVDVKWENRPNFVKAEFNYNGAILYAYYNHDGELIAITRFISSNQLPLGIVANLKKELKGYWISDLFEVKTDAGSSYYVTLENADQVLVLTCAENGDWQTFQKRSK